MEAGHDDLFPIRGSEFNLIPHDDFAMDAGDNEQHPEQPQEQEHQLNNGLDFSPIESPQTEYKREDMHLGAFTGGAPSPVAQGPPASLGAPLESPRPGPAIGSDPFFGGSPPIQIDEHQRTEQQQQQQRQLQQDIDAREKEEETLRREQRQIAEEEIKNFYEQRSKHLERRKAQLKEQAAAAAKEKNNSGSGWSRVLSLIENSSNSNSSGSTSSATPGGTASASSKDKDRAETSKLRKMLVELAAQEAKA